MHIHNSQPNHIFFDHFQTYTAIYYGHFVLSCEEKSKFDCPKMKRDAGVKAVFLLRKKTAFTPASLFIFGATNGRYAFSNKLNFSSSNSNFDFSLRDNSEVRMTIIDCCISLKMINKFWLCWELWICASFR